MGRITEDLIRKRAEHNECLITTLEEVSLHQQDIERIENIDKWCRDLKILYLQSNLIPKIENVSRLKKLEYINLALNNIERIENLEGCESLKKLDLTVNFIGALTSIECLIQSYNLREIYLTGNPCTEYEGYREYVIGTLPQLQYLDGIEIEKSERIKAKQALLATRGGIIEQQELYRRKREKEKREHLASESKQESKPGFDGRWYTDINSNGDDGTKKSENGTVESADEEESKEEQDKKFWEEKVAFTPESRIEVHKHMEEVRRKEEKKNDDAPVKERRLQADDGRMLNINDAKIDFTLTDDEENNKLILDIAVYRYMDTSLLDVDVQPTYVRVLIKGKILQLVLGEEIQADNSTAKRSQVTGHLVLTMPKANPILRPKKKQEVKNKDKKEIRQNLDEKQFVKKERLEVEPGKSKSLDFGNIVTDDNKMPKVPLLGSRPIGRRQVEDRANSEDFVDDPDVPPLL